MKREINFIEVFIFIGFFVLLIQSCKTGNKNEPTYTITGHLFTDCGMQPVANRTLELYQNVITHISNSTSGGILSTTTTDSTGYFKFDYKDNGGLEQKIRYTSGNGYNDLIAGLPLKKSIDNLITYLNPMANIQIWLNVANPRTISDTLYLTNFNNLSQKLAIPGPFTNGLLYRANNFGMLGMNYTSNPSDFGYKINGGPVQGTWTIVSFNFNVCDTSKVIVNIN